MKAFFAGLWDRIVVNYGSTLKGLGVSVLVLAIDQFVLYVGALQGASPWLKAAAAVAAMIGAAWKPKALPGEPPKA